MGVLPLQFKASACVPAIGLTGRELYEIAGVASGLKPRGTLTVRATDEEGHVSEFEVDVRIDTPEELVAFRHGGILPYVVRQLVKS
jgi:aconitate hydratase A / 2-methylisocitrate dehydratase